jgi:hypothetical protein
MFYRIAEVSHTSNISPDEVEHHFVYLLVNAWNDQASFDRGDPPKRISDFVMQLQNQSTRIVPCRATGNRPGFRRIDGACVAEVDVVGDEEWQRETLPRDVRTEIQNNIFEWWERAEARGDPTDTTDSSIQRDRSDPQGILSRPDVSNLEGARFERTSRTVTPTER